MKRIFKGKIDKCKLILDDQRGYDLLVASLSGKEIELTIGKPTKKRSNPENKYMWAVPYKMISDATGMTVDEVHDAMRMKFLIKRSKDIWTLRSTSSLSTVEFETYMSQLRQFCSEFLDFYCPEPNEIEY